MARAASDGEAYFALATKGGFRADSGPSRGDTCRLTFRPKRSGLRPRRLSFEPQRNSSTHWWRRRGEDGDWASLRIGSRQPLPEHRLAPVMDAGRTRLRAVGEGVKQIGQLRVAVLRHEPRHAVAPVPGHTARTRPTGSAH